ncbi:MAG TPA: succinylglutamate desuccinylase/aspartoacylase family protein [Aridibacter sp.]|nr:succinylglutamate desuccinylase/aspartoacylase family protein [Aridibacter sp.]
MQVQSLSIPENDPVQKVEIDDGEHLVGEFVGDENGVTVLVVGSIHGNEPSGLLAMRKIANELRKLEREIKGRVFLVAGNTRAIQRDERYIDADLNRHWTPEIIALNSPDSSIRTNRAEDTEQRELLRIFDRIFLTAKNEVYALDLHSTSAASPPFAMIGDTLRNRDFARKFPATILLGIEEQLTSTILEYINNLGAVTLGFEAGEHRQQTAVDNQEALMWLALYHSDCLRRDHVDVERHELTLREAMGSSRLIEIRYRHAITPADEFEMEPGYENFQAVEKGEVVAHDIKGEIKVNETGMILMPLYQKLGDDGFFLGREILPFWLRLSRALRKMGIPGIVHWLPGVTRDPYNAESLVVNTNIARIFPLQVLHLLGFRKRLWKSGKLVVSRRKHDTRSPFVPGD